MGGMNCKNNTDRQYRVATIEEHRQLMTFIMQNKFFLRKMKAGKI